MNAKAEVQHKVYQLKKVKKVVRILWASFGCHLINNNNN